MVFININIIIIIVPYIIHNLYILKQKTQRQNILDRAEDHIPRIQLLLIPSSMHF